MTRTLFQLQEELKASYEVQAEIPLLFHPASPLLLKDSFLELGLIVAGDKKKDKDKAEDAQDFLKSREYFLHEEERKKIRLLKRNLQRRMKRLQH